MMWTVALTACMVAAIALAVPAFADVLEDHGAAIQAFWVGDYAYVIVINSDPAQRDGRLLPSWTSTWRISAGGTAQPHDISMSADGVGAWETGSTIVVVGDSIYEVTATRAGPPRVVDIGVHVGVVWDGGLPYAITFNADTGLHSTAWNITDNMSPVEPHSYDMVDAKWGPFPGYAHVYLDGVRYGVVHEIYGNVGFPSHTGSPRYLPNPVNGIQYPPGQDGWQRPPALTDGPPVLTKIGNFDAYVDGDGVISGIAVSGNNYGLSVTQGVNYTASSYHFSNAVGDVPTLKSRVSAASGSTWAARQDSTMVVVEIDGINHAVVNTLGGPPVLVDAPGAAALGMGDIRHAVPADTMLWERPSGLDTVRLDAGASMQIMKDSVGHTYSIVWSGGQPRIYEISNPLDPYEIVPLGTIGLDRQWTLGLEPPQIGFYMEASDDYREYYTGRTGVLSTAPDGTVYGTVTLRPADDGVPARGGSVAYAVLTHPERAAYDIPERFVLGEAAARLAADGVWAVMAVDGGVRLAETNPNAAVSLAYGEDRLYAVEWVGGWEDVRLHTTDGKTGESHDRVNFGYPGLRVHDIADPESPVPVDPTDLAWLWGGDTVRVPTRSGIIEMPPYDEGVFGEFGRVVTTYAGDGEYALVHARDEPASEPVMDIGTIFSDSGRWLYFTVTNIHHEALYIEIDRFTVSRANLVMERHHSYSGFAAPEPGSVRISGPTPSVGYVGPTEAYGVTRIVEPGSDFLVSRSVLHTYAPLSDPAKEIVYAFVHIRPHTLQLEPGEKAEVEITLVDPCNENVIINYPIDGNCGAWNPSIALGRLAGISSVTLVADGYPEQTVTAGTDICDPARCVLIRR